MLHIDEFESVFRAANKPRFRPGDLRFNKVLLLTDFSYEHATVVTKQIKTAVAPLTAFSEAEWIERHEGHLSVDVMLGIVSEESPDLIVTFRDLFSKQDQSLHTLGDHIEVLTQMTDAPVLLWPDPKQKDHALVDGTFSLEQVMAITDHLAGDDSLVRFASAFLGAPSEQGSKQLFLSHVEDDAVFQRYIEVIRKIPEIDTETAEQEIRKQLLKEPADYIQSCKEAFEKVKATFEVVPIVTMGHQVREYKALIESHDIDLLVLHTKDEDQMAMHGLAYPLAVELRDTPLLMI